MILKKLGWREFRKLLLVKSMRLPLKNFALVFEDSVNHCILHSYIAPLRSWQQWELEIVYWIFRNEIQEMLE